MQPKMHQSRRSEHKSASEQFLPQVICHGKDYISLWSLKITIFFSTELFAILNQIWYYCEHKTLIVYCLVLKVASKMYLKHVLVHSCQYTCAPAIKQTHMWERSCSRWGSSSWEVGLRRPSPLQHRLSRLLHSRPCSDRNTGWFSTDGRRLCATTA